MRVIFEGWRHYPHSYGVVDQFLALELFAQEGIEVFHRDIPFVFPKVRPGLGDPEMERRLAKFPTARPDQQADATVRIIAPAPLRPAAGGRTLVFCTAEFGILQPAMIEGSLATFNATADLAMMTPSEWSRSGMIRGGADPDKVVVVPHGFDPAIFKPAESAERARLRRDLGWEDDFIFLNAGALTANKGIYELLKVFAAIVPDYPKARLVLKGLDSIYSSTRSLDEYKAALTEQQRKIVEPRVTYVGKTMTFAQTAELYQSADAYVSPYKAEGFNIPALEAAACGLPLICTAGGPTDEFTDESFCLRIKSELRPARIDGIPAAHELEPDLEHLIQLMQRVMDDSGFRQKCRAAGPAYVCARSTWKHAADRLQKVLENPQALWWRARPATNPPPVLASPSQKVLELHAQASRAYQTGKREEVIRLCQEALRVDPLHADSIYLLGVVALEANQHGEALRQFHAAAAIRPRDASFVSAIGEAYRGLGKIAEATESFRAAARIDAGLSTAHNALGEVLLDNGDAAASLEHFRTAIKVRPNYERAHMNMGRAHHVLGDLEKAKDSLSESVRINPKYSTAHNNLGAVLQAQGQSALAADHFRRALNVRPNYPEAHFNLGNAMLALGDPVGAVKELQEAIRLRPNYARAHAQLAQALFDMGQVAASVPVFQTALKNNPNDNPTRLRYGETLRLLNHLEEARKVFDQALQLEPDSVEAFSHRFRVRQELCDWTNRDSEVSRLWSDAQREMASGKAASLHPLHAMSMPWDGQRQLLIAQSYAREVEKVAARVHSARATPSTQTDRIKIGYVSRDFYDHPVGHLIAPLFGLHDRKRFGVYAYSFGPNDSSTYRKRIEAGCEHFHDVMNLPLSDLNGRIRDDGIHILVDLMGFTGLARTAVFALRPAPIQASWLGYAGTMGASFIDYIIADATVTPPGKEADFREKVVRLPGSFMITDYQQELTDRKPSRREQGLPDEGFVFCGFNNAPKIEPMIFDVWMRILKQVPGSVLWLSIKEPAAQTNLRREAQSRGVDGARLIFSTHVKSKADHLARLGLADLFLDTHYYNAHATTADAMWAGLPMLTCPGDAFASRVAASVIRAAGMGDLIVPDMSTYERTAVELARDRGNARELSRKLIAAWAREPLFDTPRFVRNLERSYEVMWQTYSAGSPPAAINIEE
jgi:predicted O-linked N-acetylglucosamine transferase (SPINDLY family)/glycosyltransferase involved in cell wall biosynthesis